MDASRWEQVEAVFYEAIEFPPAERAAFLERSCAGDEALRQEVEALLAADEESQALAFEEHFIFEEAEETGGAAQGLLIGPYRLETLLGRGGMGEVYLAERADGQFKQRVALKLVRFGAAHAEVLQRFRAERQILAALKHPNIARVFDGGLTDDGRPYLVMEYVEGEPITAYCDQHRLSVEQRLRLFLQVCAAVQYAHRNLIVHRDLKPSNILVTEAGLVKLLDFGIAKLLDPEAAGVSVVETRSEVRVMTPAYAAPEQVRGDAITTATDVYALGVLLYVLLTGQLPYRPAQSGPYAVEQAVLEQYPLRPSAAAVNPAEATRSDGRILTPEEVSAARRLRPEKLRRRLAGDLDTIILAALRKEPERRYASTEALGEDLQRHLDGHPVRARPDTVGYRVRKFVGRHKAGLAAGMLVLLSLVGGLAVALWQAEVARQERNEKQMEATRANVTRDFVLSLFEQVNPEEAQGQRFTARELVEPGIRRLDDLEPAERVAVMRVLGEVCVNLGLFTTADSLHNQARALQEALLPANVSEVAAALESHATARLYIEDYGAASQMLERALAMREEMAGPENRKRLSTLNQLAYLYYVQNRLEEAEVRYQQALALRRHASGPLKTEEARSLRGLAEVYVRKGAPETALPLFDEALTRYQQVLGENHSDVSRVKFGLAQALRAVRRYQQADTLFQEALQTVQHLYGPQHNRVATILYELGVLHEEAGAPAIAESYYQQAIAIYDRVLPGPHVFKTEALGRLGLIRLQQGDYAAAEAPLRRALAIAQEASVGIEYTLRARLRLAAVLLNMGRLTETEKLLLENDATFVSNVQGEELTRFVQEETLKGLVRVYEELGREPEAAGYRSRLAALSQGE